MHTPDADETTGRLGVAGAAKQVADRAKALVSLELELAAIELKRKASALGIGIGLALGAAVFGLFAFGFLLATVAAALATFLATWLSLLIVTLFLLVVAGVLGMLGLGRIRRGTPPVPEQAIREAKLTTAALKSNG
ncbi:MAG: phage holin family protein [Actinobacteria bacterium]|nr:phage holin family protein [Actinomycetota bacterium]